jgi:hypothetical protein
VLLAQFKPKRKLYKLILNKINMQNKEITQLRRDVNNLKEVVGILSTLMNKKLIKELQEEANNIEDGEFLTEEEFEKKHKVKIR